MKKMKRPTYYLLSNFGYHTANAWRWNRKLVLFQILEILPGVFSGYVAALIPAQLVRCLGNKSPLSQLMLTVISLVLILLLCDLIHNIMKEYLYRNSAALTLYYDRQCFDKIMRMDYDLLENPQIQKLTGNVWNILRNEYAIQNSITQMPKLFVAVFSTLWYGYLLGQNSPVIVLALVVASLVSVLMLSKARSLHNQKSQELGQYAKQADYINRQAMERASGKDIRMYGMKNLFLSKHRQAVQSMYRVYGTIHHSLFLRKTTDYIVLFLAKIVSYGILLIMLTEGRLEVADVVLYIGLIDVFSTAFKDSIHQIMELNPCNHAIEQIRRFLDLEEETTSGTGIGPQALEAMKQTGVKVEFSHVSYTYPGNDTPTLKDINLIIQPGEKLALIGLNGAGKTTLVKLLCGFYKPTEGTILVNDIPISQYTREEYAQLVSALFQDSSLLPLSLDTNLTGSDTVDAKPDTKPIDQRRLRHMLSLSGFLSRYDSLPQGGRTLLVREVNEEATDFSGGEKQKLLFARALYKQAPLLILDEPTAALDPIAENEMYLKYGEAAKNRTSLYISHRLSSTRFCDRIILLEHAGIQEEGTHEELMKLDGRYAKLYELQSQYYKEQHKEVDIHEKTGLD